MGLRLGRIELWELLSDFGGFGKLGRLFDYFEGIQNWFWPTLNITYEKNHFENENSSKRRTHHQTHRKGTGVK